MKITPLIKISIYILLWVSYFLLQYYFLSFPFDTNSALILASRVVLIHGFLFYVNSYLLLPGLLDKNRYILYFLSICLLLILTFYLFAFSNELGIVREALESGRFRRFRAGPNVERTFRSRIFINNLISSLAVLFISTTYWIIRRSQQRKQHEINLINENLQTEMKFLKSQVNPHFLLNALNNIYSLASIKSPKTPEMVMRLSEMLKYVLYGANTKKVPLEQEITYIKDYIAFQKLKYEQEPAITADFNNINPELNIAPMLLIPFIENSFKHSNLDDEEGYVNILITTVDQKIHLAIENSINNTYQKKDKLGGIGLNNVRRRLNLLYPEKHTLKISQGANVFTVELTLNVL